MSDEHDDAPGRPLPDPVDPSGPVEPTGLADQAEQQRVSRLLATAGGGEETVPPDVAARLDAVLADLTAGRPAPGDTAPGPVAPSAEVPDEVAARRRRRRWPQLLVAAAAVSVLGLGAGTLLDSMGSGSSDSAGEAMAGAAAEDPGAAADGTGPREGATPTSRLRQQTPVDETEELSGDTAEADARALATIGVPRLRSGSLAVDLQRAADLSRPGDGGRDLARSCVQPDLTPGDQWLRVRLDGAPAVLVLRAPEGGRRTAEVYTCDDGDTPAASRRIDAR